RIIAPSDVDALATMPSAEELRARLVGMLASPMTRTLGVLSGPSRSLAYLLNARSEQLGGGAAAAD
ncbi:MAG TPA: 50S ribosomal protein L10, partial [Thermomicrobiales bacterium]|nr:50S ribosomal protein L10 [Thermomicrobiales bacterium]